MKCRNAQAPIEKIEKLTYITEHNNQQQTMVTLTTALLHAVNILSKLNLQLNTRVLKLDEPKSKSICRPIRPC
jgi:hypothetical protein